MLVSRIINETGGHRLLVIPLAEPAIQIGQKIQIGYKQSQKRNKRAGISNQNQTRHRPDGDEQETSNLITNPKNK